MMIVVKSELKFGDSQKVFYCGSLFSGVIVDVVDGVVVAKKLCRQGEVVGDYTLPFPLYETSKLEIDAEFLEGDETDTVIMKNILTDHQNILLLIIV